MVQVKVCGLRRQNNHSVVIFGLDHNSSSASKSSFHKFKTRRGQSSSTLHKTRTIQPLGKQKYALKPSCGQEVQEISSKHKLQDHISQATMSLGFNNLFTSTATVTGGENVALLGWWRQNSRATRAVG